MASLQAPGIGSGLDINGIVSQLMVLERRPLDDLVKKESQINAQISAYGQLKSQVSNFQSAMNNLSSAEKFRLYSSSSSDESVLKITASSAAAKGVYAIDVSRIAENHKKASTTFADSDTTTFSGAESSSTSVLEINLDGGTSVSFDVSGKTLAQAAELINNQTDNPGVTASIIKEDAGYRLLLTADETGSSNFINVVSDSAGFSFSDLNQDRDSSGSFTSADLDAVMTFENTYTVTRSSNNVSDLITGVTLDIKQAGTVNVNIDRDDTAITEAVQAFADAFNNLRDEIKNQRAGQLEADSTLTSIESRIFSILNAGDAISNSSFSFLSEVGLSVDKLGKMNIDSSLMTQQMNADFDSFVNLFAAEDEGFAYRLDELAKTFLETDGLIDAREDGLQGRIDFIQDQKLQIEARLVNTEARIRKQFTAMDTFVAQMNATGSFLTQQLVAPNKK